ncbi:hypothetical protein [Mesorhizobium sp. CN2-181]
MSTPRINLSIYILPALTAALAAPLLAACLMTELLVDIANGP